jgi:hypothetical protein
MIAAQFTCMRIKEDEKLSTWRENNFETTGLGGTPTLGILCDFESLSPIAV